MKSILCKGLCAVLALGALVAAWPGRADPTRSVPSHDSSEFQSRPGDPFTILIATAPGADPRAVAGAHQLSFVRSLPDLGYVVLAGAGSPRAARRALLADPRVAQVSFNLPFAASGGPCCHPDAEVDVDSALEAGRAQVRAGFGPLMDRASGEGVLVAVLDTGVDANHEALRGALVPGRSFLEGGAWDEDLSGHGTAMASLVAARPDAAGHGLVGVAPGARILPVRVADRGGKAWLAEVAAGLVWAVDRGAQVALLSLGAALPSPALDQALDYAEQRGCLVVAAAGNRNTNVDLYPAAAPSVLSVACARDDGGLALSTTLAPSTDLLAPGVGALVALPRGGYGTVSGSSVSAARVAGAAALLRQLHPELNPADLRRLLTAARRPLPLLADDPETARVFRAGVLDCAALVGACRENALRLEDARALPPRVQRGEAVTVSVRAVNLGARPRPAGRLTVTVAGRPAGELALPALPPGGEVELSARLVSPGAGQVAISSGCGARSVCALAEGPAEDDLALSGLRARPTADGGLEVEAEVEGRGRPEGGQLTLTLAGSLTAALPFPPLAAGERRRLTRTFSPEELEGMPTGPVQLQAEFCDRCQDARPRADRGALDLVLPDPEGRRLPGPAQAQYQQSGEVNIIVDAPWRLAPGRDAVPLLVFMAEKGDQDPTSWVAVDHTRVEARDLPMRGNLPATLLYDDVLGGATQAVPGLALLEEQGQPALLNGALDLRLFRHREQAVPGRYVIMRLPRSAFGVASTPAADEVRYIDVTLEWRHRRRLLYAFYDTATGTTRKTVRVRFAAQERPRLSGGGSYFDAHVHTIAEWYQDDSFDPIAPRKALGGPIPMLREAAFALGITDALDPGLGRLVTTDHNTFYSAGDSLRDRPPFGPTARSASGTQDEFTRMGELLGVSRGEEISFTSPRTMFGFLPLPLGAHLLAYRAQHVDGAWHGGSALARTLGDPSPDVRLEDVLTTLTRQERATNHRAALYAAHPFDGMGWQPEHFEAAFELDPAARDDRAVHAEGTSFVTKGLQLWNGHFGRHTLPAERVNFGRVDPWNDPDFVRGNPDWDQTLNRGLAAWHKDLAALLRYELKGRPGVRFPRKMFALAGTDAHGDFNLTEDRLATAVGFQSTFTIDDSAFGSTLTYALPVNKPGHAPAEQPFAALLDGNSVLTDGPLVTFSLDAEDRFDGQTLQWHDARAVAEDQDGRIGGGGAFDGEGTALVRRGAGSVRLRYRYSSTPEWGDLTTIAIHASRPGDPNPAATRASGATYLLPRGTLAPGGADLDLEERLDPAEEGLISAPTALQLAAYTGDPAALDVDAGRCLTNPIWCVPFDAEAVVERVEIDAQGRGVIPPGALKVAFTSEMSFDPRPYAVELKALDAQGDSTPATRGPIDQLVPAAGSGWSDANGVVNGRLELVNQRPIPLDLDRYGGPDTVTFVVYFYDAPCDAFGNALNRPAFSFSATGIGTGGGTGPEVARASATTAPAAQPGASPASGGRRGGAGGCALSGASSSPRPGLLLLGLLLLAARRRRGPSAA